MTIDPTTSPDRATTPAPAAGLGAGAGVTPTEVTAAGSGPATEVASSASAPATVPVAEPSDRRRKRQRGLRLVVKRGVDLLGAGSALLASAPVMGAVAVAIKLDSPGPVLYVSERIGRDGQPFPLIKFRSMSTGAPRQAHQDFLRASRRGELEQEHHKVENDHRITRVGRVIRRLSLDELPQLINVVRGEMSLVGPRPDLPYAVELYRADDWHRFEVLPGITGLWQVSGRSSLSVDEMYRLDQRYATGWSTRTDLEILARTVPALVRLRTSG